MSNVSPIYLSLHPTPSLRLRVLGNFLSSRNLLTVDVIQFYLRSFLLFKACEEKVQNPWHWASVTGDMSFLKWLHIHDIPERSSQAVILAAQFGHLPVIEFFYEHYYDDYVVCAQKAMEWATAGHHTDTVKFLYTHRNWDFHSRFLKSATSKGYLDIVQYFVKKGENGPERVMDFAALKGELTTVRWLHENCPNSCTSDAMDFAAMNGYVDTVSFLHHNRSEGCTATAMNRAARNGHLEVVRFLHEHRSEGCTTDAMNDAAMNGHLEVVRFLHEHRSEGCTTRAMDCAAGNGHLEVVRFLHERRAEGCTMDAMDQAACSNHLEVVHFLHEHRSEGCTTGAMDGAARYGHLDVIQFLHDHRKEGCTIGALSWANYNKHSTVVTFLRKHYPHLSAR